MGGGTATGRNRIIIVDFEKADEREEKVTHTHTGIYITLTLLNRSVDLIRAEAVSFTPIKYKTTKGNVGQVMSLVNYNESDRTDYQDYKSFIEMLKNENNVEQVLGLSQDELLRKCLIASKRLRNIETALTERP
jgi:hypothetical protein